MKRLAAFFASMTGRVFLILLVGVTLSAAVAWGLAEGKRQGDLRRLDMARAVDRVEDVVGVWRALPPSQRMSFVTPRQRGVGPAADGLAGGPREAGLEQQLAARFPGLDIAAQRVTDTACRSAQGGRGDRGPGPGGGDRGAAQSCWRVVIRDGASALSLVVESQPRPRFQSLLLDPIYLGVLLIAAAALALLVARITAAPLLSLSRAAHDLGDDLTRQPLPLTGPSELREAAGAFNAMQLRLQRQLAERTHMLAAITHDLQTPVTRLRLRLEKVEQPDLRERLLGDLSAMQTLIREGLELARSSEHAEGRMTVDLASLVESLVDDAADAGQAVSLGAACEIDVTVQVDAVRRVISNLIDNALKYGGSAEVSVAREAGAAVVRVRDHGPGLPIDQAEAVFEPFVRLEDSRSRETGGAGLGLTIARTLAERNGATLILANHPEGGAEAVLQFR